MKLKKGFSLIELLVVVAIIGILAAIGTVGYNSYVSQADSGANAANDKQVADAVLVEDTQLNKCSAGSGCGCANIIASNSNINKWSGCSGNGTNLSIGAQTITVGTNLTNN